MKLRNKAVKSGSSPASCSSFAAGQKVTLRNHVTGIDWDELTIESVGKWVIARTRSGNERRFKLDGVATWSCNLSIRATNDKTEPRL